MAHSMRRKRLSCAQEYVLPARRRFYPRTTLMSVSSMRYQGPEDSGCSPTYKEAGRHQQTLL